jgi:hypothetical protein
VAEVGAVVVDLDDLVALEIGARGRGVESSCALDAAERFVEVDSVLTFDGAT